jgi:gamma-glutamyltranspeptidase/glutathione hydrolase
MSENFNRRQKVTKAAVRGKGVVVAQNTLAAKAGAGILAKGGNAIDAAVATAFAIGAVEPWMSGIGGIGFMTVWSAKDKKAFTVDYGPRASRHIDPADYKVIGEKTPGDLFGWAPVLEDRNVHGYHSIAVPAQVEGMATALARFGTMKWADLLQPGIALADAGLQGDWYSTVLMAAEAKTLLKYETSRKTYLPDGYIPQTDWAGNAPRFKLGNLAKTYRRLAEAGHRDYYEGQIARDLVADLQAGGSKIALDDLAACKARVVEPLSFEHNGLTAGPTLRKAMSLLGGRTRGQGAPDADFFVAVAEAMHAAYVERFETMGEGDIASCTTHFCTADAEGNMVALTQTLLSIFGSRVMLPRTGIMMNNGMNWFDPEPGKPNSIAPGKRPLTNICPVVVSKDGKPWFCIGASGGRRIVPAVMQLALLQIDRGMDVEAAFHQPRIDVSGTGPIRLNEDLPDAVKAAIGKKLDTVELTNVIYPLHFANPSCIVRAADGSLAGMNEVMSPWAGGAAV